MSGDVALGFEVCDLGQTCRFTPGRLVSDTVVSLDPVDGVQVATVRYGWADAPLLNLYDVHGQPASPFQVAVQ